MKKVAFLILLMVNISYAQENCGPISSTTPQVVPVTSTPTTPRSLSEFNSKILSPGVTVTINGTNTAIATVSEFQLAKVTNGVNSTMVLARLNPASNSFEIKQENNDGEGAKIYELNTIKNLSLTFTDSDETYKVISYVDENGLTISDFFVFDSNSINNNLLKKESFKFIKGRVATSSYTQDKPSTYKKSIKYFFKTNTNELVELSTKRKNIAKAYALNSEKLMDFMKDSKINTKKESDLIKLVAYLTKLEMNINNSESALASNE